MIHNLWIITRTFMAYPFYIGKIRKKNRWIRKPPQISRQLTSSQHITKTMYSFVPIQPKRALNSIQGTFEAYLTPGILKSLVAQLPRFGSMTKIIGRQIFQSFQFYYLQQIIYWSLIRQWNGSAIPWCIFVIVFCTLILNFLAGILIGCITAITLQLFSLKSIWFSRMRDCIHVTEYSFFSLTTIQV